MNCCNPALVSVMSAALLAPLAAFATNGYYTHGVGTKSKAQAGAGIANPEEILVLATNPAGIASIGDGFDAGLGLFSPMRDYSTSTSQANGGCSPQGCAFTIGPNSLSSKNELFPVPFIGRKWTLSDVDHLALAFYARGGMNTQWDGGTATFDPTFGRGAPMSFPGTFGAGTAGVDLMQAFLNLSYARELTDQFSVGVSGIFAIQRFEARGLANFAPFTKTYVQSFFTTGTPVFPTNLTNNGHEMSYGYGAAVGFQWTPNDQFSLAAGYTSKMTMSEFGDYADLFAERGGFDLPSTWTVGVAFKPSKQLAVMLDVQGIEYSDADSVSNGIQNLFSCPIFNQASTAFDNCLGGRNGAGFGWDDMVVYKLGFAWKYSDDWTFRGGFSTTDQPIPPSQMTFNILAPGVIEQHFTLGLTKRRPNGNEFSISLMYAPETTVRGPQNFDPSQSVELKMDQVELEFSYSWKR